VSVNVTRGAVVAVATDRLWLGPSHYEARAAYHRARGAGLTSLRALVVGTIGSFQDCWSFRSTIATFLGCSVRTVQRAITQAKQEGLIGVARSKVTVKPDGSREFEPAPKLGKPIPCGWSHRWTVGWGKAGEAVQRAVEAARARWLVRHAVHLPARTHATLNVKAPGKTGRQALSPSGRELRTMDREEIQRELDDALAVLPRATPPPD
jgi:hypothetical protein